MSDYVITRSTENTDELYHYGVLGMKWGVHRASKQYSKSTSAEDRKKATDKMNVNMRKASKKLNKYYVKTNKKLDKAVKKRYGFFGNNSRYTKAKAKAERTAYKGNKWYKNMEKTFGKQTLVSISNKDKSIGQEYAKFFDQKAGFTDSYYNYEYR